jgi:integrase
MERIEITKSYKTKRPLKTPIIINVAKAQNDLEENIYKYVLETFVPLQPLFAKFTLENNSTLKMARHLFLHRTGSKSTLYTYISSVWQFNKYLNLGLDQIIAGCKQEDTASKQRFLKQLTNSLDSYIYAQKQENIAPCTLKSRLSFIKAFFRSNDIEIGFPYNLPSRPAYQDRAPTSDELVKVLNIAKLRERVMISMMAVGGFRVSTLLALQYKHVRYDLERGVIPLHVHVDAQITKGKYHSYDTFLNEEATEYLKCYLEARRRGTRRIKPEQINDNSPIIRNNLSNDVKTITPHGLDKLINALYVRAGVATLLPSSSLSKISRKRYDVRIHSLRKFFRTELASRGVERDYIEFMLGHKKDRYNDVKMKGVEFLRGVYLTGGISIRPKLKLGKIETLQEILKAWGLKPEEVLKPEVLEPSNSWNTAEK